MSEKSPGKSHATAWTLAILLVPVLYLLCVPPFYRLAGHRRVIHPGFGLVLHGFWEPSIPPRWVEAVGAPYFYLTTVNHVGQVLLRYEYFCYTVGSTAPKAKADLRPIRP